MKYGDCIRCGHCCLDMPCGAGRRDPCEYLSVDANGIYTCSEWPFTHLSGFAQRCLEANKGCGGGGNNPRYVKLWKKLTNYVEEA